MFAIFFGACNNSPEESEPEVPEIPQRVYSDSHLMVFNTPSDIGNIDVTINRVAADATLESAEFTKYHQLDPGVVEVSVMRPNSSEVLLTKTFSLEAGYFYSSYFHKNKDGVYDLKLVQDFHEEKRLGRLGTVAVNFLTVNLAQNSPAEGLAVYNFASYRVCGEDRPRLWKWTNEVLLSESQSNDQALFGDFSNGLVVTSSLADPNEFENPWVIPIEGITHHTKTAEQRSCPGGIGCAGKWGFEDYPNIDITLEGSKSYVFVAYDHETEEGKINGKIVQLSNIAIKKKTNL